MFYVYILRSQAEPEQWYTGLTDDLRARIAAHNSGGEKHTSKYVPWTLVQYSAFSNRAKAAAFEQYLKSGSGRAFAQKHLR